MEQKSKCRKNTTTHLSEENMDESLYNLGTGQWFSTRDNFNTRRHSAMSGDIFGCRNCQSPTGIEWVEVRDPAEYPIKHRTASHNKDLFLAPWLRYSKSRCNERNYWWFWLNTNFKNWKISFWINLTINLNILYRFFIIIM